MISVIFVTRQDIINTENKLNKLHSFFKTGSESDAVCDFVTCLKPLLIRGTAMDFLTVCEQAAKNMAIPGKLPETYDNYTYRGHAGYDPFFSLKKSLVKILPKKLWVL